MYHSISLDPRHAKRFLQGFPWVYANEIIWDENAKMLVPGTIVHLLYRGMSLGLGFYHRHSLIVFRLLTRNATEVIDSQFFSRQFEQALKIRASFYPEPFYRLMHAQADGLDGVIVDRFGQTLVVQFNSAGAELCSAEIIEALQSVVRPSTIVVQRDNKKRLEEKLPLLPIECVGTPVTALEVLENKLQYQIALGKGQKTGWFYDHRHNRSLIAPFAQGKRVLDYFCYAGGFSLNCAAAGALEVIGIDRASAAIEIAGKAAKLNNLSHNTTFVVAEVFEDMEHRIAKGETAELVILDPPAFIKTKKDFAVGLKGYQKLMTKALSLVAKQGLLLIASCSYHLEEGDLKQCLAKALQHHQREGRILARLSTGFDHPKHSFLEEVDYLKGFLVMVL